MPDPRPRPSAHRRPEVGTPGPGPLDLAVAERAVRPGHDELARLGDRPVAGAPEPSIDRPGRAARRELDPRLEGRRSAEVDLEAVEPRPDRGMRQVRRPGALVIGGDGDRKST